MDQMVGSWQSVGFRAALRRDAEENSHIQAIRLVAAETPSLWLRFVPRASRLVDVMIAASVAYFWL